MTRPKIPIEKDRYDYILEIVGVVAVVFMFAIPLYFYDQLPEQVAAQFDGQGKINREMNRSGIWIIPFIGLVSFAGLTYLLKIPHVFNYPVEITEENAKSQYLMGTKLLRSVNVFVSIILAFATWSMVSASMGTDVTWIMYLVSVLCLGLFILIFYYLYTAFTKKPS